MISVTPLQKSRGSWDPFWNIIDYLCINELDIWALINISRSLFSRKQQQYLRSFLFQYQIGFISFYSLILTWPSLFYYFASKSKTSLFFILTVAAFFANYRANGNEKNESDIKHASAVYTVEYHQILIYF